MEFISKWNIKSLSRKYNISEYLLSGHDVLYKGKVPCDVVHVDGSFFLKAAPDQLFKDTATEMGFKWTEQHGSLMPADSHGITGYRSFGKTEIDGEYAFWFCMASRGEDGNMPSQLDYFRISKMEYDQRHVLKMNLDGSFLASVPLSSAKNPAVENMVVRNAVLGIETEIAGQNLPSIIESARHNPDDSDYDGYGGGNEGILSKLNSMVSHGILKVGAVVLACMVFMLTGVYAVISALSPSMETVDLADLYGLDKPDEVAVLYNGEVTDIRGLYLDGSVYVPFSFAKEYMNKRLYLDSAEKRMFLSLPDSMLEFKEGDRKYSDGGSSGTYEKVIYRTINDGTAWINLGFLGEHSSVSIVETEQPHIVSVTKIDEPMDVEIAVAVHETYMREKPGIKERIVSAVYEGEELTVIDGSGEWIYVSSAGGLKGYVKADETDGITRKTINPEPDEGYRHNIYDSKICMAWHQVTNKSANDGIGGVLERTKGINVICPTWFYLSDSEGGIADLGSSEYVERCHENKVLVWGLVSNLEEPSADTAAVLRSSKSRRKLVDNIVAVSMKYGLDGINIDFEALSADSGDDFIQFVRELALALDDTEIVLSIDNYVPSSYTMFYDRREQAAYADYIVIMAYDEHTSGSENAGSVASFPWVSRGLEDTLKEVPRRQVVLGMPLYTRIWKTVDGKLTSDTVGMAEASGRVLEAGTDMVWDEQMRQHHAVYTDNENVLCEVWLEDAESISNRLALMRKHNIGGAAFWKTGLETDGIWDDIIKGYSVTD